MTAQGGAASATTLPRTRVSGGTWSAGLRNQARREAATWWSGGRWWRQTLLWAGLLNGLVVAMLWLLPALLSGVEGNDAGATDVAATAAQFAELAAVITAAGVVILTQGVLLDDLRLGLTEWMLSKPLARPALVLAKVGGHLAGLIPAAVVIPWIGVYALLSVAAGAAWPVGAFIGTVVLVALFAAFHLSLVVALSVWTGRRGTVLAVPFALLVGVDVVIGAAPWVADWVPYVLNRVGAAVLVTGALPAAGPVLATIGWSVALVAAAVWRFTRLEL